ncbi:AVAST type 3 anti-phage nuclease/ATPase Avs3a [Methylocystis parvus]|uniref:ATP-binding protein n=2 Tax=Methylocystis parvus TaxID=134 RepID=A0A6B8MAI2_9HYPH|nr:ATP-binding protein [Methylocystis parvus]
MPNTNLVRPSRDGDQFHYLWAARRCLKLLSADSGLVAVSIEGPSPSEQPGAGPVEAGEELIDVAEYFESEDIGQARLVRYMQLKHSTLHANDPWTASGLEKTIKGFARRYAELQKAHAQVGLAKKLEFCFVTNRPISTNVVETVADAAADAITRHPDELKKLQKFTGLAGSELAAFCKLLRFEDRQDGYWHQRNILFQEVSGYLPDADVDAPTQLKELVTRRALSEGEQNPTITKTDVLRALKTDEIHLFPAKCLIEDIRDAVPREQELELIGQIVGATGPVIVHASGGVGKSVFATRIGRSLPEGSVCVLYDCFGNGQYRSAVGYRHRYKDALVQIANELATKSLCHPLIQTTNADAAAYVRAFVHRLGQAVKILRSANPNALLCIVVDAADNAQMAAEEIGEARSFARDLIRASIPEGARLVFLCRSHRQHLLDPPTEAMPIELRPFSRNETSAFLRKTFPDANERDIDELHRLSSHNPRVQALALSRGLPLQETLRLLGPNPTSVEDTIANLLHDAIAKLKDASGPIEKERVEKICTGLAALRPLIPIPILSAMSGVEQEAIKSFAYDIGRPLLVAGETIQFLDEPAETWFRDKFKPTAHGMAGFIISLKPLATRSAYVASMLPQLMLQAGQFSELVELALSSAALPEGSPLEKRGVELQRLQFALKAGLRSQRYLEAAKLALKAGGETAGDERQRTLLQENTDLASDFLELDLIQEIVSRRTFGSGWVGSHHAYEAALLSGRKELVGDARSRLRMAHEWLQNWARLTPEERKKEEISDEDIVELTLAHLNIHGPADAAESLRGWKPREVSYRVGRPVIRRLIDHGRWSDVDELTRTSGNNLCLVLAVAAELRDVHKTPPNEVTEQAFRQLLKHRIKLSNRNGWDDNEAALDAVTAVVEATLKKSLCTQSDAAVLLARYLPAEPPRGLASRFSKARFPLLRAYCLRAALEGKPIELIDVAYAELKKEIEKKNKHTTSRDLQEFQEDIGALLPWHKLWASVLLGHVKKEDVTNEIEKTSEASANAERVRYREESHTSNEIALLWMDILHESETTDEAALASFNQWKNRLKRPLFTPTLNALCRLCAQRDETKPAALAYATESYTLTKDERSNAESKSEGYLEVARAILTTSKADAKAYFNEAVEVAGKIGDENLARWDAILDLADRASRVDRPAPKTAYQFARCAELTYDYVVRDKHFAWNDTVVALCGLCPSSAVAILSRWRDRGFGWHERLLPIAIGNLIERNIIDPRDALPLIGFRAQWDYHELLGAALARSKNAEERALASRILYRYAQFSVFASSNLKSLQHVATKHGVTLERLADAIVSSERKEVAHKKEAARYEQPLSAAEESKRSPWNDIFATKDLATADGLSQAYLTFKRTERPWGREDFFTEAMRRVPVGSEAGFIEAVAGTPEFSLYSFRTFLERVPESWKGRPAISHALANALKVLCRRYCMEVRKSRYYEVFPFELACSLAGVSQAEIVDVVLAATGETPDLVETSRLFSLVGLLAIKLTHDEALEALTYGLNLFNSVLEDKDGDGPWKDAFSPTGDIREAVAGYVWSALAAPEAVLRWEAAHAVLELCRFDRQDVVGHLMKMAASKSGGPFVDARLPFYTLHAFQWLLISLARAALEAPSAVTPYAKQLVDWALKDQPHILIRQFAARAAIQLIAKGYLNDENGLSDRLRGVNKSPLAVVESKTYERNISRKHGTNAESDEDRFYFGLDIGPYWYDPLGRVFAMSQGDIEAEALKVIRKEFASSAKGRWDEDERARRNLYEEQHTYHSHGSYPRADNLHFYHAYHAMMIVAGRLLATMPTHRNPDYGEDDEFADWLSRHDLTRQDSRWLWDRRDPEPLAKGTWLDRDKEHPDRRLVTDGDFDEALRAGDRLNLWGYWTEADTSREQSTHIYSALVPPDKSEALLRALASAKDVNDYAIPSADGDMEIDEPGFELKGWIFDHNGDRRLDEKDRWAGGVSFPPPRPAPFIVERMRLDTDADLRFWKDQSKICVMESQVWGYYDEAKRHESSNPNRGSRLQVSASFVGSMLGELDRDLIIEVQIERRRRYQPYESGEKDDDERIKTSAKLYLLGKDGKFRTR